MGSSRFLGHDSNRLQTLHRLATDLASYSVHTPFLLLAEDVHRSDPEVLEFLRVLLLQSDGPVVVMTSSTDLEDPALVRALLRTISVREDAHSETLARLSESDTSAYVSSALGHCRGIAALGEKVHVMSGGNPLLIQEAIAGLIHEKAISKHPSGWSIDTQRLDMGALPRNMGELARLRIASLDQRLVSLLEIMSVFAKPVTALHLQALTERDLSALARDLSALESIGHLTRSGADHTFAFAFRHAFVREYVHDRIEPLNKRRLHCAVGTLIERSSPSLTPDSIQALAHHFVQAVDLDKGPLYAFKAAQLALDGLAVNRAIHWYSAGLDLTRRENTSQRFHGLERLGQLLVMTGVLDRADAVYREMLLLARTTSSCEKEAAAVLGIAKLFISGGEIQKALAYADEAMKKYNALRLRRGEASAILARASALYKIGEFEGAMAAVHAAQKLADDSQDYYELSLAAGLEGLVNCNLGRHVEALASFEAALKLKRRIDDVEGIAVTLCNIGFTHLECGEVDLARASLSQALSFARGRGVSLAGVLAALNLGEVEGMLGDLQAALALLNEAAALSESSGRMLYAAYAYYSMGLIHGQLGRYGTAMDCTERSIRMNRESGSRRELGLGLVSLSRLQQVCGSQKAAMTSAAEALELSEALKIEPLLRAARLRMSSLLAAESPSRAREYLPESEITEARAAGRKDNLSKLLAGRAAIRLAEGDAGGALEDIREHKELARAIGLRPDVAKAALVEAQALLKVKQPVEARLQLEQACTDARDMGLRPLMTQLLYWLSQAQDATKQEEPAAHSIFEAAGIVREIAGGIKEPGLRQSYLASAMSLAVLQRSERLERAGFRRPELPEASDRAPEKSAADIFAEAARQLGANAGLRDLLTAALDRTIEAIRADRGLLVLLDRDPSNPEVSIARNLEGETLQDAADYCRGIVQDADGKPLLVVDVPRDERFRHRRSVTLHHILSLMCVPLRSKERLLGALYFDSRSGDRLFRQADLNVVEGVAERTAAAIEEARENQQLRERAVTMNRELARRYHIDSLVGDSPAMQRVFRMMESVIRADCNVLLAGESGTGKELVARAIHYAGARKLCNFVPLDCGAVPDTLVESELFGYRKGAFSGADSDKKGLFEEADGGTLFLDEIANSSGTFQAKLLRALQSGEFRRLGDTLARRADVRIIAATNADIDQLIKNGRFREDLYYRLNVVTLNLPPLRERREDIAPLADHFARAFCSARGITYQGLGEGALARLEAHVWPGNVRELENAVESALIMSAEGMVRRESLPEKILGGHSDQLRDLLTTRILASAEPPAESHAGPDAPEPAPADERALVEQALARAGGDKSRAARLLGWNRMRLYRCMKRFGIDYATGQGQS